MSSPTKSSLIRYFIYTGFFLILASSAILRPPAIFPGTNQKDSYYYIYFLDMLKAYVRETKLFDF